MTDRLYTLYCATLIVLITATGVIAATPLKKTFLGPVYDDPPYWVSPNWNNQNWDQVLNKPKDQNNGG